MLNMSLISLSDHFCCIQWKNFHHKRNKTFYNHDLNSICEMILVPCKVSLFPFILILIFLHLNQCGHIYRHVCCLPVMINWLWKDQYRPELLKNAADEIHGEWETCKNPSEIQWPSHRQITHAMWQESIYTDERLKGKEKNVWKYHLKVATAKCCTAISQIWLPFSKTRKKYAPSV